MKFTRTAIWSTLGFVAATTLSTSNVHAFSPVPTNTAAQRSAAFTPRSIANNQNNHRMASASSTSLNAYTVGIVGATGAVGKEIRNCLEDRGILKVDKLRFFGSQRSAGKKVATKNSGDVEIELFDVAAARECDVIFLAVDGDFALAHAKAISEGDDGAVVIDNSVSDKYMEYKIHALKLAWNFLLRHNMDMCRYWSQFTCYHNRILSLTFLFQILTNPSWRENPTT